MFLVLALSLHCRRSPGFILVISFVCRTDCCFSPDDKLIVTGTSVQRGCGNGKLVFFERRTFQRVYEIDITDAVCSFFFSLLLNEVKLASLVLF